MLRNAGFPALLLVVMASSLAARQSPTPARPAYDGSDSPAAPMQVHINQDCRIVPDPSHLTHNKKPYSFADPVICHLETISASQHLEELAVGNQLERNRVNISEHEFVLQNIEDKPVVFLVEQAVPKGWTVDSDPQPSKYVGSTAVFSVYAQPGESVRLHVGMRHSTPLRTEILRVSAPGSTAH